MAGLMFQKSLKNVWCKWFIRNKDNFEVVTDERIWKIEKKIYC